MRFVIFLSSIIGLFASCSHQETSITPTQSTITASVYASATIQPDSLYKVYANVSGILETNLVEEGDSIKKGQPILRVINTTPALSEENARLALALSQQQYAGSNAILKSIKEEIQATTLRLHQDSVNYQRQQRLWNNAIGSQITLENMKLTYEQSQIALNSLRQKYNQTQAELKTQVKQARNNYSTAIKRNADHQILSTINGKVYALNKNPGEHVNPQEPIATVGKSDSFIIEMLVDEEDIVKVTNGQEVLLTLDAYMDEVFTAYVHKIYPKKDDRNQTFLVEAIFNKPPTVLYPGLSGEANIITSVKRDAFIIPKSYILKGDSVRTSEGNRAIVKGIQTLDSVEIVSGISKEMKLLKPKAP